jgi:hypothetical protein
MSVTPHVSKLTELRSKTDRDLSKIIGHALEVGVLLASTSPLSTSAGRLHDRAREIYADTLTLLPKVEDVGERLRLEDRLKVLRDRLEGRQAVAFGSSV